MSNESDARRMKIHVWVPDFASGIGGIQTFSRFVVRALRDLFPSAHITVLSKNDASYPDRADDVADRFHASGWWSPRLRTAVFAGRLFLEAALGRPDLIITTHVHFAPVAQFVQKVFGVPFLAVGHGIEVWNIPKRSVRDALRAASSLAAVSDFSRQRMASALSISPDRIALLPNTFDAEKFVPGPKPHFLLKRYGLRGEHRVIFTVARLSETEAYKGYDQILRALPAVRQRFPDVRYVLAGRGGDRARIESMIRELGVESNVTLAGFLPAHELCSHYNLCDVFAMPSKGEGFGIVFLEALACGKPVIAGNKDGSLDAVLNGALGALVDPENVAEIANAICGQLGAGSRERGKILRRKVTEAFGYERFREKLAAVLTAARGQNSLRPMLRAPSSLP